MTQEADLRVSRSCPRSLKAKKKKKPTNLISLKQRKLNISHAFIELNFLPFPLRVFVRLINILAYTLKIN